MGRVTPNFASAHVDLPTGNFASNGTAAWTWFNLMRLQSKANFASRWVDIHVVGSYA